MMPSYFIAHGAPALVLDHNEYTAFLKRFILQEKVPKAIVIFTAHWESDVQQISAANSYEMIYDFYGFQKELYQVTYPAPGMPELSEHIQQLLKDHHLSSRLDETRGLDHGVWSVLKLIYPQATVPVIALSVNSELSNAAQYELGKSLASLKEQDVLIIGSGGTVHNLSQVQWDAEVADEWALAFDHWLEGKIEAWDKESLFRYAELAPFADKAVPTREHFIPLLLAMGAGDAKRQATLLHRSYQYGNLSLSCWRFE